MRTARLLPVSPSMHCAWWGGGAWSRRGVPGPWGVYPSMQWGRPSSPVNRITDMCRKVMFLHVSVILFTGGVYPIACWDTPPGVPTETPLDGGCLIPGGCLLLGGVPGPGGCIPACNGADPPFVNRITDTCKNNLAPNFVAGGNENNS